MFRKIVPLCVLSFLVAGFLRLPAFPQNPQGSSPPERPVTARPCPDITVARVRATLVSTLLGDLQVEVPMDTVRLEATLENAGSAAVPAGAYLYIIVKKNGKVIQSANATDALNAPGSRWVYSVNDSFPIGQKTVYTVQASSLIRECRVDNNRATLAIDEKKLHPSGNPDLTVSLLAIDKRWQREDDRVQALFEMAVDVANRGSGRSSGDSRLLFIQNGDQVLAALDIPAQQLPGPGEKKRFSTQLTAEQAPIGDMIVSAYIEPARNEFARDNNWSLNHVEITNNADPPGRLLAVLDIQPWRLSGRSLSSTIQAANLQNRPLRGLRLLLLKNDAPVKEWRSLSFAAQESLLFRYAEERRPEPERFGVDRFRAILTSDAGQGTPSGDSLLDTRPRNLYRVKMSEAQLQGGLQDRNSGLAALISRNDQGWSIRETPVRIAADGIRVDVKGRSPGGQAPGREFHVEARLRASTGFGRIKVEVIKTVASPGSGSSDLIGPLLSSLLCQCAQAAIEKFAAAELARNLWSLSAALPPGARSHPGPPLGVMATEGALDIFF